jgi:hypothetical protein
MQRLLPIILFSLIYVAAVPSRVFAIPYQVVIIRHGEKPASGNHLDAEGIRRAKGLPEFFSNSIEVNGYGEAKIAGLYAMAPQNKKGTFRPIETVTPTSIQLNLPINEEFQKDDLDKLVKQVMKNPEYDGKTVVICWEHTFIPKLAKAFGMKSPPDWNGNDIFDRAWILKFNSHGKIQYFHDIPERVLPTDEKVAEFWQMGNPSKKKIRRNPECGMKRFVDSVWSSGE